MVKFPIIRASISNLTRSFFGKNLRDRVRVAKWRLKTKIYAKPITMADFREALLHLGNWHNRTVWVQSSWNEMYSVQAKPSEIIDMMRDMVGPLGNVVMPAFPIHPNPKKPLKIDSVPASTGLLAEVFRRHPDAHRSIHLRSSVAAIGPDAAAICARHHLIPYSWGDESPYGWLYKHDALLVLIGFVPMGFTPLHWVECALHAQGRPIAGVFQNLMTYHWQKKNGKSGVHSFYDRHGKIYPKQLIRHYSPDIYRACRISGLSLQSMPAKAGIGRAFDLAAQGISIYRIGK